MELMIIFGVPGLVLAYVIYTRHRERMEAIKRGVHAYRLPSEPKGGNLALAMGLFVAGIGLALALSGSGLWGHVERDTLTGGMVLLFAGSALLLYWKLTAQDRKKAREFYEKRLEIYFQELPNQGEKTENTSRQHEESSAHAGEM